MFGDKRSTKEKVSKTKKSNPIHKALMSKVDKNYAKQGNKEAHKRIKKEGMDFSKI